MNTEGPASWGFLLYCIMDDKYKQWVENGTIWADDSTAFRLIDFKLEDRIGTGKWEWELAPEYKQRIMKKNILNIVAIACIGTGAFLMMVAGEALASYGTLVLGIGIGYFIKINTD